MSDLLQHDLLIEEERSRASSVESTSVTSRSRSGSVSGGVFYNQRLVSPFLTGIEKLDEYQHFIQEVEQPMYTLSVKELKGESRDLMTS